MIGLNVRNGSLYFNDTLISNSIGEIGLYARPNRDLYFNSDKIASGDIGNPVGLYFDGDKIYFDGVEVGQSSVPNNEFSPEGYWIPPTQPENIEGKNWTYATIISKYDELVASEPRLTKHRYSELSTTGGYELYHYLYEPESYDKTIFMQAGIHGNEKDSRLTLYRMMQILFTLRETKGYTAWQQIYNRCRLIIIPVVNPYGNDNAAMNIPYKDTQYGINSNRNYDFNHQVALASVGVGGDVPFDVSEVRHTREVVEKYGAHTIDYAIDFHDGESVAQHYWINYSVDAPNRTLVNDFINYLLNKYAPGQTPVIPNCRDTSTTGTTSSYFNKSLGVTASTNEWMGGIFGYSFDSEHMTHSLDIRANMLFIALNNDVKGWQVRESENAEYFHFDYPRAFTRDSIRKEESGVETKVPDSKIRARWDTLQAKYPLLISKSEVLGVNATGDNVHSYTFGSGAKKVMYVGGVMRYGGTHKIDEFAIYQLIEYLCNDYIVSQSRFLQDLRNNYTIIVLPFIDNVATNLAGISAAGLNNTALSRQRWIIDTVTNKTVPASNEYGTGNYGVQIIKSIIDSNTDLKCIVSGGEITTGYGGNDQTEYATDFQTHFVVPKNMMFNAADYANHLTVNRDENVVVENTRGFTFADYAYDHFSIPTYFVQLKVSNRWSELSADHTLTAEHYMYANFEAGRRMANIVNLFVN